MCQYPQKGNPSRFLWVCELRNSDLFPPLARGGLGWGRFWAVFLQSTPSQPPPGQGRGNFVTHSMGHYLGVYFYLLLTACHLLGEVGVSHNIVLYFLCDQ